MSPAHVLKPTYDRLKRELMQGVWGQNVRLEAARIAEDYGVSATPVRDSLNLLVGEGMINFHPGEGYRTKVITERDLAELLAMNSMLLLAAISMAPAGLEDRKQDSSPGEDQYADAARTLFQKVALASDNRVLVGFVTRLNDRLHPIRLKEHLIFANLDTEIASLRTAFLISPATAIDALVGYHDRRIGIAGRLAASLE